MQKGMDVEAVMRVADMIEEGAEQFRQNAQDCRSAVEDILWMGEDRDHMVTEVAEITASLMRSADRFQELADEARRNAQEQDSTSST